MLARSVARMRQNLQQLSSLVRSWASVARKQGKETICVFGTSLSEQGGWVCHLERQVSSRFADRFIAVKNLGRGGHDTQAGLQRLDELHEVAPTIILIEFATNDAYLPYNVSPAKSISLTEQLILEIRRRLPYATIFLMTMNPVIGQKALADHPALPKYFEGYRKLAAKLGTGLIDIEPNWGVPTSKLIPDGTHPTVEAHLAITVPTILAALTQHLTDATRLQ